MIYTRIPDFDHFKQYRIALEDLDRCIHAAASSYVNKHYPYPYTSIEEKSLNTREKFKNTALLASTLLPYGAIIQNKECLKILLSIPGVDVNAIDKHTQLNSLQIAEKFQCTEIIGLLNCYQLFKQFIQHSVSDVKTIIIPIDYNINSISYKNALEALQCLLPHYKSNEKEKSVFQKISTSNAI